MSAESQIIRDTLEDSLADLDDSIGTSEEDVRLLSDLQRRIDDLLDSHRGIGPEIRALLQERYNDGNLRRETYQLVGSLLDRQVTEDVKTTPKAASRDTGRDFVSELDADTAQLGLDSSQPQDTPEPSFASTTVLHDEELRPATADDQVQVGSVLRDRFLLQERVSGGSMGVVYKALDRRMAEAGAGAPWVAIKVLSPQLSQNGHALRALQQEAAKGRCLAHNHIVRFIDLDRDDELYFIVMEWMEGETLASILDAAEGKAMSVARAVEIVEQVGSALLYAHRCGIVHADVKPGNIMILPSGEAKLFDFGVARVRQTQELTSTDQFNPSILGALTPAYSSMQVLTGDEPVPADDVFSLGCLFYRLVAGHRVFGPRNAAEAAEAGMTPQRPQGLNESQWRALKKAISFSRVTRFQTMEGFLEALKDNRPAPTRIHNLKIDTPHELDEASGGGHSISWLLGFIALLALIGFGVYQFGFSDRFAWSEPARDWLQSTIATVREQFEGDDEPVAASAGQSASGDIVELGEQRAPEIATTDGEAADATVEPGAAAPASAGEASAIEAGDTAPMSADGGTAPEMDEPIARIVDYASMPAANYEVPLVETSAEPAPVDIRLREDAEPVSVDLMRTDDLEFPLRLRIEEVSYSGNRSPWASGQYSLSEDGLVEIPAGQDRARITLSMSSDPLREADQLSTLRVRPADSTTTQFAALEVILEDDDQRAFESELPVNTIAFAVSQVSVRERDPVVQIDVLRFNPDDSQIVVGYEVKDITAEEGKDYFSPGGYSVSFGPGQRSARLLIPLVQDSIAEGDEAFTVELATRDADLRNDVFHRIIVMIRDDESSAF